ASAGHDGTARLWEVATGKQRGVIDRGSYVASVAFSLDGRTLAVPGNAGIELWGVDPLKKQRTLARKGCDYTRACFADRGRILIGGIDRVNPRATPLGIW